MRFINDRNLDAITYLHSRGADIDAEVNGQPTVVNAAWGADWDVVWRLIELGTRTDTPKAAVGLVGTFKIPGATLPDSPIYPFKVKVWLVLVARQDEAPDFAPEGHGSAKSKTYYAIDSQRNL
ncbi:hypothetical protein [Burkholderia cenocepacia]|uniref:hypothetical protein n=2 Tax=Burkholderiaceae TaxID=119060 RepID=UPI00097C5975|nr:hypothetical protein [Burkholderia cenocepacia]AQQ20441.1 hypothetical protein A8D61_19220 [Burkholderia cenocepacia]MBJ9896454.1 hypothetical protein [Burkholderia cenocepacia]MBJ9914181.1 hypothetical protein [Burkholderia cenocepacia]MBR8120061.1 hypothetical protein [Burkholderia cenocepacia]MBR8370148.1 hypothetical protein [Burkholderia cenocepacia]